MFLQFLLGGVVSLVNFTIHALIMTPLVSVAQAAKVQRRSHPSLFLVVAMIPTVSVLMIGHIIEVFVWALACWIVGAAPPEANVVYLAFVSFATLGYGDVLPVERWILLGPIVNERRTALRVVDRSDF